MKAELKYISKVLKSKNDILRAITTAGEHHFRYQVVSGVPRSLQGQVLDQ